MSQLPPVPCSGCKRCEKECFANIPVSEYIALFNECLRDDKIDSEKKDAYREIASRPLSSPASECTGCRKCETVCPSSVQVSEIIRIIASALGNS